MTDQLLSIENYSLYKTWTEKYSRVHYEVDIRKLDIHKSYSKFIDSEFQKEYIDKLNAYLKLCLVKTNGTVKIFPYPDLIFNALNITPLDRIKVVILGQDPYHGFEIFHDKIVPQAMGLSFSVPDGETIPSSLNNIYKNMIKFGHLDKMPKNGNLTFWALQGCLMLNTSLTVQSGIPNSHCRYWLPFSDSLIQYISDECDKIVFVLWGSCSLQKLNLIDYKKHHVIISSHPSGLSANKPLKSFKSFNEVDHFGEINNYLKQDKKTTILWNLPDNSDKK